MHQRFIQAKGEQWTLYTIMLNTFPICHKKMVYDNYSEFSISHGQFSTKYLQETPRSLQCNTVQYIMKRCSKIQSNIII